MADTQIKKGDNIVIYGAGYDGIAAFTMLLNEGIYVRCFCDADENKRHIRIMNKEVISPETLFDLVKKEEIKVVIGSREHYDAIKVILNKNGIFSVYRMGEQYSRTINVGDIYKIGAGAWYTIIEQSRQKKIFVYGNSEVEKDFVRKLKLMDIDVKGYIVSEEQLRECCADKTILLEEVIEEYSDTCMIYILTDIYSKAEILKSKKLKYGDQYRLGFWISAQARDKNLFVRKDINCGYSYVDDERYPGYTVMKTDDCPKCRIMILGASTADANLYYFSSWSECLLQIAKKEGVSIEIFNGAMSGYTVQQELIKLLRDLPSVKPDIVVEYSGTLCALNRIADNSYFQHDQPWANGYTKRILENVEVSQRGVINKEDVLQILGVRESNEVCIGLRQEVEDTPQNAAKNRSYAINCMAAICKSQGIKFRSFFDPTIAYSSIIGKYDQEKIYHASDYVKVVKNKKWYLDFRQEVIQMMDKNFQCDLSGVLENHDQVYEIMWHPNKKGNKIIAEEIFKQIRFDILSK